MSRTLAWWASCGALGAERTGIMKIPPAFSNGEMALEGNSSGALFPSPLVGEGGFAKRCRVRGISPHGTASQVERYPSSGASRHLLPQGEKERTIMPGRLR